MKKITDEDWEKIFGIKKDDKEKKESQEFINHIENLSVDNTKETPYSDVSPRKIKIPKKSKLNIEDEIDLHGLIKLEAENRLKNFFVNAKSEHLKVVLVISGKGKHSEGGPSLKPFVEKWFKNEGKSFIKSYGIAPKAHGGEGAFIVFLK